jgi:hypothetical protein
MEFPNLLSENIYSKKFEGDFLVIGSCVSKLYPEIIQEFQNEWKNVFSFCLEQFHYNQLMAKLFDILALGKTNRVGFLTVDGSPHCVQMHFASKYLKRGLAKNVEYKHYVINNDKKVFLVSLEAIDKMRDLADNGTEINI